LSKVQYESLPADLEGAVAEDDFESRVIQQVRSALEKATADNSELELLSLRLSLTGRTSLCTDMDALSGKLVEELDLTSGALTAQIESAKNHTQPDIDLQEWSLRSDPPGQLARLMLILLSREADEQADTLLRSAQQSMLGCYDAQTYGPIGGDERPTSDSVRDALLRQGMKILEILRAQKAPA